MANAPNRLLALVLTVILLTVGTKIASAESFYFLHHDKLQFEDPIPDISKKKSYRAQRARVVLDGGGEAYTFVPVSSGEIHVTVRVPHDKVVKGQLFYPVLDSERHSQHAFTIQPHLASDEAATVFYQTKRRYYKNLLSRGIPGGAWFRHQMDLAVKGIGHPVQDNITAGSSNNSIDRTYDLFSGGAAVSENLRLDWQIEGASDADKRTVEINSIRGVTVREVDWSKLNVGLKPKKDTLADYIPADQHVIFTRSFADLLSAFAESDQFLLPTFLSSGFRAEDPRIVHRYQKQLCLSLGDLKAVKSIDAISSVAVTGSDPYLDLGSDLALIVETKTPAIVTGFVEALYAKAKIENGAVESVKGKVNGLPYSGVRSPNRDVCSYLLQIDDAVVISNSLHQLHQIAKTKSGELESVAGLPEYTFLRHRYSLDDEQTAMLIMSDAAIRRWCGPRWRIGNSRRIRAAAVLSQIQAQNVQELMGDATKELNEEFSDIAGKLGRLCIRDGGAHSTVYGSLAFMTPIAELDLKKVTTSEANGYRRWRTDYERNWRQAFDPIAVRLEASMTKVSADLTIMPLMVNSQYRELIQWTSGPPIKPKMGDRHKQSLLHLIASFKANLFPISPNVVGIEVYFDESPFWQDFASTKDQNDYLRRHKYKIPAAIQLHHRDEGGVVARTREFIRQVMDTRATYENEKYHGHDFVRVTIPEDRVGIDGDGEIRIYGTVFGSRLMYTFDKDILLRAIDRHQGRAGRMKVAGVDRDWLGNNIAMQFNDGALRVFETLHNEHTQTMMKQRCWDNLPILNTWRRLFPDQDPVQVHERLWKTRLVCPGSGKYRWNDKWKTMESTVYGHPGQPRFPMGGPLPITNIKQLDLGITFENRGMRAKIEMKRE